MDLSIFRLAMDKWAAWAASRLGKLGFTTVEVLVAAGVAVIVMLGFLTMNENQGRQGKAISQKLAVLDFQSLLSETFAGSGVCSQLLVGQTFDSTQLATAQIVLPGPIPANTSANAPSIAQVNTAASVVDNSVIVNQIVVNSISNLSPGGTTSPDTFTANLQVSFGGSLIRPLKPAGVSLVLRTDPATPATAKKILTCSLGQNPPSNPPGQPAQPAQGTVCIKAVFTSTVAPLTVPLGTTSIGYTLIGGGGGGSGQNAGMTGSPGTNGSAGAVFSGVMPVTPGDTVMVYIGGGGGGGSSCLSGNTNNAGYFAGGGGGGGGYFGGGGGGSSGSAGGNCYAAGGGGGSTAIVNTTTSSVAFASGGRGGNATNLTTGGGGGGSAGGVGGIGGIWGGGGGGTGPTGGSYNGSDGSSGNGGKGGNGGGTLFGAAGGAGSNGGSGGDTHYSGSSGNGSGNGPLVIGASGQDGASGGNGGTGAGTGGGRAGFGGLAVGIIDNNGASSTPEFYSGARGDPNSYGGLSTTEGGAIYYSGGAGGASGAAYLIYQTSAGCTL